MNRWLCVCAVCRMRTRGHMQASIFSFYVFVVCETAVRAADEIEVQKTALKCCSSSKHQPIVERWHVCVCVCDASSARIS